MQTHPHIPSFLFGLVATLILLFPSGAALGQGTPSLTGTLKYASSSPTPLVGVPVHLKSYLGYTAASDTTDSTGTYHLSGFPNGNYYLDADINYEVNGINSSDALLAQRFVIMLEILSNLQQKSADVSGNQRVTSSDALMVGLFTAGIINQFPVGKFVNTRPDVTASGSVQSVNMLALASGDVNGNLLVQSSPPTLVLDTVYGNGSEGTATVRFTTSGSGIYERGVCWGTSPNPTTDSSKSVAGTGGFGFTHSFGGLAVGTQYYVRAYAMNSAGTYYSNERIFTTDAWSRCPGMPTVTDIDGNVYSTVQIGGLCWMQSNLNVGKYQNGNTVLSGLTETQWSLASAGAFSFYNNDTSTQTMFGRLYNWYSVNDPRGLCPVNWRIPTDGEYSSLIQLYGGSITAGGAIKSTSGWVSNIGSTNSSGFSGIPGGYRLSNGYFNYLGAYGYWWSSEASGQTDAWCLALYANTTSAFRDAADHRHGFSVRCVNDVTPISVLPTVMTNAITIVSPSVVTAGGIVTLDGQSFVYARGVAFGTSPNPLVSGNKTNDGTGTGSFSSTVVDLDAATTYYIRAYATNGVGTAYGGVLSFVTPPLPPTCPNVPMVSDIDGNIYNTIKIGDQCWLQSNLRVSKYRNGDHLMNLPGTTQWHQASSGAWCNYYNNFAFDSVYGKLYNRFATMDNRGLCPLGWHIPSDVEWAALSDFLGGDSISGGKLKASGTSSWSNPNIAATNSSGFAGLPGGFRSTGSGDFDLSYAGYWWSSTMDLQGNPWIRQLSFSSSDFIRSNNPVYSFPKNGLSVRCLKNTMPQVSTSSISNVTQSSAMIFGEVLSDGGEWNAIRGFCYATVSNPTILNDTTMNGTGLGIFSGTLQNLTPSTTYYVRAYATNSLGTSYGNEVSFTTDSLPGLRCPGTPSVTDVEGNVYNTIQIGNQCWTQSNLKTSKYRNGDNISTGLSNSQWSSTISGAYAIYNNDPVNDGLYGKLYNWYAVDDSRGICPTGWHVPSDGELIALSNFLGGESVAGGKLKSTATHPTTGGWNPPNTGATNSTGFSALPGGIRINNGDYMTLGTHGYWWSNSIELNSNADSRYSHLYFSSNGFNRNFTVKSYGFSVRCLKNSLPQVNTSSVTNVTPSTALVTGEVISEGDQNTTRGFCYSTTSNPTLSNDTTMNGTGAGVYTGTLMNLSPLSTYYVRAYATNSLGTSYGNEINFLTAQQLNIGMNYQGGIIFHLAPNGQNGLICAPVDQSSSARWGCTSIMYNTSTLIGSGQTNTNSIINLCGTRPIAASICNDLNLNGFNDWYLPSLDELYIMIQTLHPLNIGNFSANHYYQSSSENGINSTWIVSPTHGVNMGCKSCNGRVRAIRSF